ncbi:MAG: hypothetical protein JXX28_14985 [Deltaproteobacteria bacterium]|nr:hypothetical protein [Deltaproteobacteria bacterium]
MMRPIALLLALVPALTPAVAQAQDPERVVLSLQEFLQMYEAAREPKETPERAPNDWAISSAAYVGEVRMEGDEPQSAVFSARLQVEVLKEKGWVKVPLLPTSVALKSARIGGKEVPVVMEGSRFVLVTDRRGVFEVDVEFAASVFTSEGSSGFSFQLVPSGATAVELSVPTEDGLSFTVANARLQEKETRGGRRVVKAILPAVGSLAVSWQREVPEVAEQQSRVYAEVYTLVGLGDGLLTANSTIHHTILHEGVDQLRVGLPEGMTLLDVKGTGVRDWTVSGTELTVSLNYEAIGAYPLTLEMEKLVGEGDVNTVAPFPTPIGVERSKGWVGVQAIGNLELGSGEVKNASAVDVRSLPAAILGITDQPVLLGYKYLGTDARIPLQITEHDDVDVLVTLLDQAKATTMWTPDGRRLTSIRYQVRNNRKQFLRLSLPDGAVLWSASVGGRAVQPAQAGDGRLLVPLLRSQATGGSLAAFDVEVVYVEDGVEPDGSGKGTFEAHLPTPDVPTTYVGWVVYAPVEAKVKQRSVDGPLRQVDWLSNPIPAAETYYVANNTPMVQQAAGHMASTGGLGEGAAPVPVSLPLEGQQYYFEKLLVLDEELWLRFDYAGLKR